MSLISVVAFGGLNCVPAVLPSAKKAVSNSAVNLCAWFAERLATKPSTPKRRISFSSTSSTNSRSTLIGTVTVLPFTFLPFPAVLAVPYACELAFANLFASTVPESGSPDKSVFLIFVEIAFFWKFAMTPSYASFKSIFPCPSGSWSSNTLNDVILVDSAIS